MSASWLTAMVGVASFLVGVVLPFLFKRFSHEGYSLREVPWGSFGAIAVKVGQTGVKHGVFGVIKAANANPDPILIEDLRIGPLAAVFENSTEDDIRQDLYLLDIDRDRAITFPPVTADLHRWKTLPLVLEPRVERELALWIGVEFNDRDTEHRPFGHLKPIDLMWKVSGKSRKLKVTPRSKAISISLEVLDENPNLEMLPVQILPPGAAPSSMPPGEAIGVRARATVSGINLAEIDLTEGHLEDATLDDVTLDRARMAGANMRRSTLHKVTAIGADLTDAHLEDATLDDVTLDRAQLVSANLEGIGGNTVVMTDANAADANLARAQLQDANLMRIDLSRADLRWARSCMALTFPRLT